MVKKETEKSFKGNTGLGEGGVHFIVCVLDVVERKKRKGL